MDFSNPVSVIPSGPLAWLRALFLQAAVPRECHARVDDAIQVPPPVCRRLALGQGLIRTVAGVPELAAADAPRIVIFGGGRGGAGNLSLIHI